MGNDTKRTKEGLEFGEEEYDEIALFCDNLELDWFASAWDIESQKVLRKYNLKINKVASAMTTNIEFVQEVASEQIPTFVQLVCVLWMRLQKL